MTRTLAALLFFAPSLLAQDAGKQETTRVAGIVLKWVRGDKEENWKRAEPLIREAARGGARIVCTTECFLDGYAIADKKMPVEKYRALGEAIPDGPYCLKLAALAKELKIHLIAGLHEVDGDAHHNTALLFDTEGKISGKYRKQKLGHELDRNTPGKESSVFKTVHGRVGMMICADRTEPTLVKRFGDGKAELLICPSGGMFGPKSNDPILQARSRENGLPILFVHPAEFLVTGGDGSILSRIILGDSLLVAPEEVGKERDAKQVFYYDLPIRRK
jgi:predicted amidohydrolase